jgi:hypothetical protein
VEVCWRSFQIGRNSFIARRKPAPQKTCGAFAGIRVQITDVLDPDENLLRISLTCWSSAADQLPDENLDETECQAVTEMV